MNTKSKKIVINPEFEDLFAFKSEKEIIDHKAQMISYRILSEVERICEIKKLKKKDLAIGIGSSQSYITQLFRGNKSINTQVMAKFEQLLNISFEIDAKFNDEEQISFNEFQTYWTSNRKQPIMDSEGVWLYCYSNKKAKNNADETADILKQMKPDNIKPEMAA